MLTRDCYLFFFVYCLTLFKQGKPPIRPALYRESIFSRRLLFMRRIKKSSCTLRTLNLEKCCSPCNLVWWYSVVAFPRIEREYLADAGCRNFSPFDSLFQKLQVFILDSKARVRWTCKSGGGLFKTLSRVIYCNFNSWCKTHSSKMCEEEIYADAGA